MCSTLLPIWPRIALIMVPVPLLDSLAMLSRRKRSAQVAQSSHTPGFMARSSTAIWPGWLVMVTFLHGDEQKIMQKTTTAWPE
jgi:hypothetical protein